MSTVLPNSLYVVCILFHLIFRVIQGGNSMYEKTEVSLSSLIILVNFPKLQTHHIQKSKSILSDFKLYNLKQKAVLF